MIRDDFFWFHGEEDGADDDLTELLDEDGSDDVPACDAVAFGDFFWSVDAVFVEPWPRLKVKEVEEAGVGPIHYDWEEKRQVFIGDEREYGRSWY